MAIFVDLSDEDDETPYPSSNNMAHGGGGAHGHPYHYHQHHFSIHEHSNYLSGTTSQPLVVNHGVNTTETEDTRNLGSQIATSREADRAFVSLTKVFAAYP